MSATATVSTPTGLAPSVPTAILAIARRELRDALSSKWFAMFTIAFAGLAIALSFLSLAGAS